MAGNKALTLSIRIAGKMDKSLTAVVNGAQSQITSLSKGLSKAGTIGLASMGAIATGAVATIARCTKEAEQFANGMGDVVKYVSGLADADGKISNQLAYNGKAYAQNYAEISKAIRDLSTQIPYTQAELQQLAASAGQSGKSITDLYKYDSGGQLSGFLKDVAMMGTAWDIEASQAGDWAAKWEVALGKNHDQIMTLADQINYLGANNATTAAEIGDVVNRVASFGQVAGMQAEDTAALATSLLAMGVEGAKAASSISRMYTNLNKGASATKAQKEMWESMGMTAAGVAKGMQKDATGTLVSVFNAVKQLPDEKRVAALSTLFGQWAIEGGGKLTTNLEAFTGALKSIQDPKNYEGSMSRELAIKMGTPEAVSQMLSSSVSALKGEVGESFLPVKREFSLAMIDAINGMRQHMPEISRFADTLAGSLSSGIGKISDAVQSGMPVFLRGLDYVANNGPKVVSILEKLVAVLAAMKFAPGIENLLGGAGGAVLGKKQIKGGRKGGLLGLFRGGQNAVQNASGLVGGMFQAISAGAGMANSSMTRVNGEAITHTGLEGKFQALSNTLLGGFFGLKNKNTLTSSKGTDKTYLKNMLGVADQIASAKQNGGLLGMAKGAVSNSGVGQYAKGILSSFGKLKGTKVGGGVGVVGGTVWEILTNISQATGLTDLAKGSANAAKGGIGRLGGTLSAIGGMAGKLSMPKLTNTKQFVGASAGFLSSVWGPMAGGFGSLFAGAAPIIASISGIIAVVSILGDHLDDIRGIVGSVFGDEGVAVFDSFTGKLSAVGDFISGLFKDGGVANALAPLQQSITNMFGDGAGAAFGGVVQILQSVMGVIGQIVAFSTGTVKPIIQDIFSFITGTVMPIILQTFTAAAPTISSIISNIGSAVMTGMQMIGTAIQIVMPFIKGLITTFLSIASVVIPAVLTGIQVFSAGISGVLGSVQGIFQGLVTFFTGVFTLNLGQALEGVKQIFGNAFNALIDLVKTPVNAVIGIINGLFSALRNINITIPDWSPIAPGASLGFGNLPTLPTFARGGFTRGASIAGEAGTEAVISFQRGVRNRNIDTWMRAGQMLGVGSRLKEISMDGITGPIEFRFAPVLNIQGNTDAETINRVLSDKMKEFEAMCEAWWAKKMRQQARRSY